MGHRRPAAGLEALDNPPTWASPAETGADAWTPERLRSALADYRVDHERVRFDPEARNLRHTHVDPSNDRRTWRVQQVLVDPALPNDWMAELEVDLWASCQANQPVLWLRGSGRSGSPHALSHLALSSVALRSRSVSGEAVSPSDGKRTRRDATEVEWLPRGHALVESRTR